MTKNHLGDHPRHIEHHLRHLLEDEQEGLQEDDKIKIIAKMFCGTLQTVAILAPLYLLEKGKTKSLLYLLEKGKTKSLLYLLEKGKTKSLL
jgi:hypothetical protein